MSRNTFLGVLALAAVLLMAGLPSLEPPDSASAAGDGFEVNATDDVNDNECDATHCSLREAILAANGNDNPTELDSINFNIPGAGPHTIEIETALPQVSQAVHINGESQPGASCAFPGRTLLVEIVATGVGPYNGIVVNHAGAVGTMLSGLAIHSFEWNAVNLGGGAPHTLRCSHLGLDPGGSSAPGNGLSGLNANNAPGISVGGDLSGDRNVFAGNSTRGISVLFTTGGATIRNNYFGVTADGMTQASNNGGDVFLSTSTDVNFQHNRFASTGTSISVVGISSGHIIRSNTFGLDANGAPFPVGPSVAVYISVADGLTSTGHQIGGILAGQPNKMAVNVSGVQIQPTGTGDLSGVTIRGNEIHAKASQGHLGIDLIPVGSSPGVVQLNDAMDADGGPNGLQNYPVLFDASNLTSTVNGELSSAPLEAYDIDFYAGDACTSGRDGNRYLGSLSVFTNGAGYTTFGASGLDAFDAAEGITATATDADGNTSEFSACVPGGVKTLDSLAPTEAVAGSADTVVTLTGVAFQDGDTATFSGDPVATTFMNPTELQFTVTPAMKFAPGTRFVEVSGALGQLQFQVTRSSSDIDCDNLAKASDASYLLRVLAGLQIPTGDCPLDANQSGGNANIADVLHIRLEVAGLVEPLKSLFQ